MEIADRDRREAALQAEVKALDERNTAAMEEHRQALLKTLAGEVCASSP